MRCKQGFSLSVIGKVLAATVLCVSFANAASAQVVARKADSPPFINGKLDDKCWLDAPSYAEFNKNGGNGKRAESKTSFKILFDDSALYVGIRCETPDPGKLKIAKKTSRDGNIYSQDCVELMLDPSRTQSRYFHFLVSAGGALYDEFVTQGGIVSDKGWNGAWEAKTHIGADYWSCEMRIPFFNFSEATELKNIWGINVCRGNRNPNEDSSIAQNGIYGNCGEFLALKGLNVDLTPYQVSLKKPSARMTVAGKSIGVEILSDLKNFTGKKLSATCEGWMVSPSGKIKFTGAKTSEISNGKTAALVLPSIQLSEQGEYKCSLKVSDGGKTIAYQESAINVRYAPVEISLKTPWYRHCVFETQKIEKIEFDVLLLMPRKDIAGKILVVEIKNGEKVVWSKTLRNPTRKNAFSVENSLLPYARMNIVASLKKSNGEAMEFSTTKCPLWKLPYKQNETWLGRDYNWYVNGKKFYFNSGYFDMRYYTKEHTAFMRMTNSDPSKKWISSNVLYGIGHDKAAMLALKEKHLDEATKKKYRELVRKDKDAPNLFAYYFIDEPPGRGIQPSVLRDAYEVMVDEDPYHPCIISDDKMPNTTKHLECCDIQTYHPYPPMLKSKRINDNSVCVAKDADEIKRYLKGKYHKVSIIFMHMGFNINDYGLGPKNSRMGNYDEFRGQSIMALTVGAKGFFPYNRNVDDYPETSIGLPYLTKELSYYEAAVLAPESKIKPKSSIESIRMLLKDVNDHLVFFTSNVSAKPCDATFTLAGFPSDVKSLWVISENRRVPVKNGIFTDHFDVCEGHVYTTGEPPRLKPISEIKAEIEAAYQKRKKPGNLVFQRDCGDAVDIKVSSSKNVYGKNPYSTVWHVTDGQFASPKNDYGFMQWKDATPNKFPDWIELDLRKPVEVGRVEVYPMSKSLKDYKVQAWVNGKWIDVAEVRNQKSDHISHKFAPVATNKIRLWITATNGPNSIISEIEVYNK